MYDVLYIAFPITSHLPASSFSPPLPPPLPSHSPPLSPPRPALLRFALDGDSVTVGGLMADSPLDRTREAAYRVYLHPDPRQETLLSALLQTRHALAELCGFPSFAHR